MRLVSIPLRGILLAAGLLTVLLAVPGVPGSGGLLAATCPATPAQAEGPYYPVAPIPMRGDLIGPGTPRGGAVILLSGQVLGTDCAPVAGARVEIWQTDAAGHYDHPGDVPKERLDPAFRYFGAVESDAQGRFRFRTLLPAAYGSRPPHIHVKVMHPAHRPLTTQLYFAGTPHRSSDWLYRRVPEAKRQAVETTLEAPPEAGVDHGARWNIVLKPR